MREFTLAAAIVVAGFAQAQAQTMPAHVPSTYPASGMFCGFMEMCTPKAKAPRPAETVAQDKAVRPAQ